MIDTASGGDGGRLVDLIARLEKTYRRAVDDVNRATDRDIDRAARRKMLLEFGEPTAALALAARIREMAEANPEMAMHEIAAALKVNVGRVSEVLGRGEPATVEQQQPALPVVEGV